MTQSERVTAIVRVGFTERQARFLVLVMQVSGVCLLRQCTAFAGIVHGQKTRNFFAKLVGRRYATAYACRHNRGHVYHVPNRAVGRMRLYRMDNDFRGIPAGHDRGRSTPSSADRGP